MYFKVYRSWKIRRDYLRRSWICDGTAVDVLPQSTAVPLVLLNLVQL